MTVTTPHDRPLPLPPLRPEPRLLVDAAVRGAHRLGLPSGLPATAWRRRHAVALAAGSAVLPVLALLAGAAGRPLPAVLVAVLGPAALLLAGSLRVLPLRVRSALTAAALVAGCCTAVCLSPATTEAHFAFFLTAALLGHYRDWAVYPVAVAVALLWPDLAGSGQAVGHLASVPGTAGLHAALVVAGAAVVLVGWALADASTRSPAGTA